MHILKPVEERIVAGSRRKLLRGMAGLSLGLPISQAGMLPLLGESPIERQES